MNFNFTVMWVGLSSSMRSRLRNPAVSRVVIVTSLINRSESSPILSAVIVCSYSALVLCTSVIQEERRDTVRGYSSPAWRSGDNCREERESSNLT